MCLEFHDGYIVSGCWKLKRKFLLLCCARESPCTSNSSTWDVWPTPPTCWPRKARPSSSIRSVMSRFTCKRRKQQGVSIRHIFETHLHADFVSGHKELAARTGATIYIGDSAGAMFPHVPVKDGFALQVGKLRIDGLETPGHTPESICLVITDEEKSQRPWAVLTGDTLFIGDVGRPDLSKTHTPQELAGLMYDSLARQAADVARRRAGLSRARGRLAVRAEHARRTLLHHRDRTAHQLCAADQAAAKILCGR